MLELPFSESHEMPYEIKELDNPIPYTEVNSRPLEETGFVAPYVPCAMDVALDAIKFSELCNKDTLVDLGCGDARICVLALQRAPKLTAAIGVEMDPYLAAYARKRLWEYPNAIIKECDMFEVDLEALSATVLILYLLPGGLDRLKPLLKDWLAASTLRRVITIKYQIPGWQESMKKVSNGDILWKYVG